MFYFEGYSIREIAQKESITEGNVKIRMMRLRKKLVARFDTMILITFTLICFWIG